uniref:YIP1 family protein n=1 Tax=Ammonifex degensii TaxID=42838 RepID=A0A7C1F2V0_9THEO
MVNNNGGRNRPGLLELVHGVLFSPASVFRAVAETPPLKEAALIFFLLAFGSSLAGSLLLRSNIAAVPGVEIPQVTRVVSGLLPVFLLVSLVFAAARLFLFAAVFHFLAELLGGRGTPQGTLTVCALAGLPGIFLVPVELLLNLWKVAAAPAAAIGGLVGLGVLLWQVMLLVIGLREVHRFTTGTAAVAVVLPLAVLIGLFVALLIGMIASLGMLLPSLSSR